MRIVMEAFGDALVDRKLLRMSEHVGNMQPVLAAIADDFYDIEAAQFATEGRRSGHPWQPLKPSTLAQKRRMGLGSRGILELHLDLEESLTGRTHANSVYRVTHDELEVGTRDPVAWYHQKGFRHWISGEQVPARPPVELTEKDKRGMVKRVQRFLVDGTVRAADFVVGL